MEARSFPTVLHLADPEEFWDPERCPGWAHERGWFYGFDLTPGVGMYMNFARNREAARVFFERHQDRLMFGTDAGASAVQQRPPTGLDRAESLGRIRVVRHFLETGEALGAPAGVGYWMGEGGAPFHGIALPSDVLHKIYVGNFERTLVSRPPRWRG